MKKIMLVFVCVMLLQSVFSQTSGDTQVVSVSSTGTSVYGEDIIRGLEAYRLRNWEDALFFLKRATGENIATDAVWYIMLTTESNLQDYNAVLKDGKKFLEVFSDSPYVADVLYQTILAQFNLSMYEDVVAEFSAFIDQYPNHDSVPSAIFWIAESLYHLYDFELSRALHEQLIADYPQNPYYSDSVIRLELLDQRAREEKLLYLLRVTGEESLAAKEDYERQIRQLQTEESFTLQKRLQELQQDYIQLQTDYERLVLENHNLQNQVTAFSVQTQPITSFTESQIIAPVTESQTTTPVTEWQTTTPVTEWQTITPVTDSQRIVEDVVQTSTESTGNTMIDELAKKSIELQKMLNEQ